MDPLHMTFLWTHVAPHLGSFSFASNDPFAFCWYGSLNVVIWRESTVCWLHVYSLIEMIEEIKFILDVEPGLKFKVFGCKGVAIRES